MINNRLLAGTLALVLIAGLGSPAFAQFGTGSGTPGPSGTTSVTTTQQANLLCTLVDFEGVGDLNPVGTIGDATFSANTIGFVDSDAGGTCTGCANEPSPDTVAIDLLGPSPMTVTLANPAVQVSFFYSAFQAGTVDFLDGGGGVLATIPLPATPLVAGDPNPQTAPSFVQVSHNAGFPNIESVVITENPLFLVIDDFEFCNTSVGGELLPIDSTALVLAGLQTSAIWMLPVLAGVAGSAFGILYIKSRRN